MGIPLGMGTECEDIHIPHTWSTRENPLWRRISIRWTNVPFCWCQSTSISDTFFLTQQTPEQNGHGSRRSMHGLHNMDFHQRQSGCSHCWMSNLPKGQKHQAPLWNNCSVAAVYRNSTLDPQVLYWQEADWENYSAANMCYFSWKRKEGP